MIVLPELNAVVSTEAEAGDRPEDVTLCGQIGHLLVSHYPDWDWRVEIPPDQNIIIIRNLTCDPYGKMGMVRYKSDLDPTLKCVVMAAGELLERYRMRRGPWTPDQTEGRIMCLAKPEP